MVDAAQASDFDNDGQIDVEIEGSHCLVVTDLDSDGDL